MGGGIAKKNVNKLHMDVRNFFEVFLSAPSANPTVK
jgi:hypothetical protein